MPAHARIDGAPAVGVLAVQGDFEAHQQALEACGARTRQVRTAAELEGLEALVLPGGESTTMTLSLERDGLTGPVRDFCAERPVLATCAGLILLDRTHLGVLDLVCERNAFGRQLQSFETDLELAGVAGGPLRAVFIRAPWVAEHGAGVEVVAEVDGHPVAVRQGEIEATAFHPELTGDRRLHERLVERARRASATGRKRNVA